MRKSLLCALSLLLILSLAACGQKAADSDTTSQPSVTESDVVTSQPSVTESDVTQEPEVIQTPEPDPDVISMVQYMGDGYTMLAPEMWTLEKKTDENNPDVTYDKWTTDEFILTSLTVAKYNGAISADEIKQQIVNSGRYNASDIFAGSREEPLYLLDQETGFDIYLIIEEANDATYIVAYSAPREIIEANETLETQLLEMVVSFELT